MSDYYDELETRNTEEREVSLIQSIRAQLVHARDHTPYFRQTLSSHDCEGFSSFEELKKIPILRKSALIEMHTKNPPIGGVSPLVIEKIRYIHASPGPIYESCSARADFWRLARALYAAGFRKGDLVHNCFSYHLTPAGAMLDSGCHALGCAVIPAGVGQTELQLQTIHDLKPDGYVGTPSFLKIILEKSEEGGFDVSCIKKGLVSGEALPPSLREQLKEYGVDVFQAYATADLGVIAYESVPDTGLILDEGVYVEIVRPGSGDPVPVGEVGEVVVTSFNPDYPLIRFATGDMSAFLEGQSPCGRTNRRIKGWMGRADQTAKVRGMFIHPEQVNRVVDRHPEIQKARLVVQWINQQDQMTLQCETLDYAENLKEAIAESIREFCRVRGSVMLVEPGSIPNDGIVIEDSRNYE
ncbi:MAG: AMP-binding protein [Gammaproteobacteria bacterium]|nr:AMP-binding protein [Gammaproteobacteria bacterium]MCY4218189.1 AMP-binding protein [Gammaproteobacteria bacterium]MCY4273940.1 AMP-binding protein [Gammaproteobacteria bacterium]